MVGRGDRDRVDVVTGQQLTEIVIARLWNEPYSFAGVFSVFGVDIAYRHHLAIRLRVKSSHITVALASGADTAHRDAVARSIGAKYR
jgi:hypothetical protein